MQTIFQAVAAMARLMVGEIVHMCVDERNANHRRRKATHPSPDHNGNEDAAGAVGARQVRRVEDVGHPPPTHICCKVGMVQKRPVLR